MDLGKKLVELRKERKLSQEDLAEVLDVTRQTISNWELGITSPDIEQTTKIAKYFNVSLDSLVGIDIKDILVEKVSNTEKLAGLILKLLRIGIVLVIIFVVFIIVTVICNIISKSNLSNSRVIHDYITCYVGNDEYAFEARYYELNGEITEAGGDAYLINVIDLTKYEDGYQVMDIINEYAKQNDGYCELSTTYEND